MHIYVTFEIGNWLRFISYRTQLNGSLYIQSFWLSFSFVIKYQGKKLYAFKVTETNLL
jgi:hypothetical protein